MSRILPDNPGRCRPSLCRRNHRGKPALPQNPSRKRGSLTRWRADYILRRLKQPTVFRLQQAARLHSSRMEPSTPMMAQYHQVKKEFPHALVFFRLGDFYEMFFDDAVLASRELEITLTARNKEKGQSVPMCGVPYHAADGYIAKLIRKGYKVAVCDQVERPRPSQKLVRREVTRVVTPGTASGNLLEPHDNNFLTSVWIEAGGAGLASLDVSTGDFRITEFAGASANALLQTELERLQPKEIIYPASCDSKNLPLARWSQRPEHPPTTGSLLLTTRSGLLTEHFGVMSLDGFGCQGHKLAVAAAGAVLHYLKDTQKSSLSHIDRLQFYEISESMALDATTVRNLELVQSLFDGSRQATLIGCLDRTSTGMGARLLKSWLLRPEIDLAEINAAPGRGGRAEATVDRAGRDQGAAAEGL